MSKRESLTRYNLIINRLRKHPATFKEIFDMLERESELQDNNFTISKRTFQRDCRDISTLYDIEIKYDSATKSYFIQYDDQTDVSERILEAFDVFNALKCSDKLSAYIHFENRKPKGTENLYGLIHSIKNCLTICFNYEKYSDPGVFNRFVEPYVLKEFRNRWYLIGKDCKNNNVRTYGLDRLTNLEITKKKFEYPQNFNHETYYKNCFGIISPKEIIPERVILSFDVETGKYIKSMPLHHTQQILEDSDLELRVQLTVCVTYDLIVEILSYGDSVKVIEPKSLVKEVVGSLIRSIRRYRDTN
jgi:predicted DNA-binding transcriptional regulator YafY